MSPAPITGEVSRQAHAFFVDQDIRTANPLVAFHYNPADPCAVRLSIPLGGDVAVWMFARDLLADGLHQHTGDGCVRVWPNDGNLLIRVANHGSNRWNVVTVRASVVRVFLAATERRVPRGSEQVDVDGWLALLDGAS